MSIMDNRPKKSRSINLKNNGSRIIERKKISNSISHFFYNLSKEEQNESIKKSLQKRSSRMRFCGERKHILSIDNTAYNLYSHKCRDRQCIECQAIRSYVWQNKISEVNEKIKSSIKAEDYSFLFLTFTIKNPLVSDLRKTLKLMNKAIYVMFKQKAYKDFLGGIRTTEITRGKGKKDECHPHFHMLLVVHKSYFEGKKITKNQYGRFLPDVEDAMSVDFGKYLSKYAGEFGLVYNPDDYKQTRTGAPIVEVKQAVGEDRKTVIDLSNAVENGGQIFGYILKYTVKGNGKADDIIFRDDDWFLEYDKQIRGVRLITPVGIYREKLAELEHKDFDFHEEMQKIQDKIAGSKTGNFSCDLYEYENKDYMIIEEDLKVNDKIERAVLTKGYNQFKKIYSNLTDYLNLQENSSDKFKNNDFDGNQSRIERINKLVDLLEKKGVFVNLNNGSYADRQTGEIYTIFENKAVDNKAVEEINIDKFKVLNLIEKQEFINDLNARKQIEIEKFFREAAIGEQWVEFERLESIRKGKEAYSNYLRDKVKVDVIDDPDDMFK